MRHTKQLVLAFILSLAVHVAMGFYLERTPWAPEGAKSVPSGEKLMQVAVVPDSTAFLPEAPVGGDPLAREDALRRALQQEVDQAPKLPEIAQQEWFSPETVAIESPKEDLIARADAELSNIEGRLEAGELSADIIKVPEPKVEAPQPDARIWAPAPAKNLPPPVAVEGSPVPPPEREDVGPPLLPPPPPPLLPSAESSDERLMPAPPVPELPKDLLAAVSEPMKGEPAPLPTDRPEFKNWDTFLDVHLSTYQPANGKGFFRVNLTPNEQSGQLTAMPKDVLFAIDASGSMEGPAFEGIKASLAKGLAMLKNGDRFNVIAFRADVVALNSGLWPVTEKSLAEARDFIRGLSPSGKTDIYSSLTSIIRSLPPGDRPFSIVVCTDGRTTVGLKDSRDIINALSLENHLRAGIHVFGVGSPDRYLLRLLSFRNKGQLRFAKSGEEAAKDLSVLLAELADPLLVDIRVDLSGMADKEIYPLILPDLHRGGNLEFYGRYGEEKEVALRVTGNVRGKLKEFVYKADLPKPDSANASIPEAWASSKAFNLVAENCEFGESEARTKTIKELARTYGLEIPLH
jgi:hypothetical protein